MIGKPRNPKLYKNIKDFMRWVEKIYTDYYDSHSLKSVLKDFVDKNEEKAIFFTVFFKPWLINYIETIVGLEGYKQVEGFKSVLEEIKSIVGENLKGNEKLILGVLLNLVADLYEKWLKGGNYFEDYILFEDFLYEERVPIKLVVPLCNLDLETEELKLDENLKIRSISEEESSRLQFLEQYLRSPEGNYGKVDPIELKWARGTNYVVECISEIGKGEMQVFSGSLLKTFQDLVCALRIFKKGEIYAFVGFYEPRWLRPNIQCFSVPASASFTWWRSHSQPMIKDEELKTFKELWNNYHKVKENFDFLRIAIGRLNIIYTRDRGEDALIDLIIGFEALFIKKRDPIQTKISQRPALFLKGRVEGMKELITESSEDIEATLKKAYRVRSKIVHGGGTPETQEIDECLSKIDDYLRMSIQGFLELMRQGKSKEQTLEELEKVNSQNQC